MRRFAQVDRFRLSIECPDLRYFPVNFPVKIHRVANCANVSANATACIIEPANFISQSTRIALARRADRLKKLFFLKLKFWFKISKKSDSGYWKKLKMRGELAEGDSSGSEDRARYLLPPCGTPKLSNMQSEFPYWQLQRKRIIFTIKKLEFCFISKFTRAAPLQCSS